MNANKSKSPQIKNAVCCAPQAHKQNICVYLRSFAFSFSFSFNGFASKVFFSGVLFSKEIEK